MSACLYIAHIILEKAKNWNDTIFTFKKVSFLRLWQRAYF
jgi:hypothetical protein